MTTVAVKNTLEFGMKKTTRRKSCIGLGSRESVLGSLAGQVSLHLRLEASIFHLNGRARDA